ncbi:hypothetical protein LEP1GSC036_0879 [Leptospira weilii str. 2006001853]|uniref:Uncharacterized protein n=1 Tax=Leptospira weilii str. 2006001853 TaxID=1001589 RepID=A0A828Z2Y3_9LEPT|nr:hypothetical protein LEP1GSC036_0879 [Leptospira weilii str. 2006001853]
MLNTSKSRERTCRKQEKVNELLSHMNSLVTNQNDLSNLQTLLQGSSQAIN